MLAGVQEERLPPPVSLPYHSGPPIPFLHCLFPPLSPVLSSPIEKASARAPKRELLEQIPANLHAVQVTAGEVSSAEANPEQIDCLIEWREIWIKTAGFVAGCAPLFLARQPSPRSRRSPDYIIIRSRAGGEPKWIISNYRIFVARRGRRIFPERQNAARKLIGIPVSRDEHGAVMDKHLHV